MEIEKSNTRSGAVGNAANRAQIGGNFGGIGTSEVQRLMLRDQLTAQMGFPFGLQRATQQEMLKARIVDQLIQSRGITRSEALQQVQNTYGL